MANAGGAWDNAKKIVETELREKGTDLHDACVVGDTVGDPFKDTSSVALNPIIKFATLFGLLAVELAIVMPVGLKIGLSVAFFMAALVFVYRSFYGMRIATDETEEEPEENGNGAHAPRTARNGDGHSVTGQDRRSQESPQPVYK
jgi:K(+)-stimulated pyrophosphate-energized sodium pump